MKIDIILPFKEIFSENKASAVSLTVKNSAEYSKFKREICVFGQYIENPFKELKFIGIKTNRLLHFGNNKSILYNYLNLLKKEPSENRIIEMHNRPYLFNMIIKNKIKFPVTLHFHNDPRTMKGSKNVSDRKFIIENSAAVYFVSQYIKDCFLDGLDANYPNLHVLPNGIQRKITTQPIKEKRILFIGRLVPEKGCHIFVEAIKEIANKNKDWKFTIIGTPKAGQDKVSLSYAKNLLRNFNLIGSNIEYLGFIPNNNVKKILEKTAILVVPSIWQEPFALTALEGICHGVAVIASKVGGMSEMLDGTGFLIDSIDSLKLKNAINLLINDPNLLKKYQNKSWKNYRYNQTDIVNNQDGFREDIIKSFTFTV